MKYLGAAFAILLLGAVIWVLWKSPQDFEALLHLTPAQIFQILFLSGIFLFSQGMILKSVLSAFGVELKIHESFSLMIVTFFANYFLPFVGIGLRGGYLVKKHRLSLSDFALASISIVVVEVIIFGGGGLLTQALIKLQGGSFDSILAGIFAAAVMAGLVAAFFPLHFLKIKKLEKFFRGARALRTHPRALGRAVLWTGLTYFSFAASFQIILHGLKLPDGWGLSFLIASLTDFSFFVRLAPAAAGSLEAAVYYVGQGVGLSLPQCLAVALSSRISLMIWFLTLGPIYLYFVFHKWKSDIGYSNV